jgi:predicted HicB family RNase H-like nuclease
MSEPRVRLTLRISKTLEARLSLEAKRQHRSLNRQIEFFLDRCVQEEKMNEAEISAAEKTERRRS